MIWLTVLEESMYEEGNSDVKKVVGDFPVILGREIGHIELGKSYSLDSVPFDTIRKFIRKAYKMVAINTISWYLYNLINGIILSS